jgi:hypothetical protein
MAMGESVSRMKRQRLKPEIPSGSERKKIKAMKESVGNGN